MHDTDFILAVVITTLLVLLLIGGLAVSFFFVAKQKAQQQASLAEAKLSYERELRQVESEVSEHLMQQFSLELHDNIGHHLTCIRLELENKKLDHPEITQVLGQMEKYLDEAHQDLRLLTRSLNSDYIAKNGLVCAINLEVQRQRSLKKFKINFKNESLEEVCPLDKNQQLMTFRIFQEVIQNALKHAKANKLSIKLKQSPNFELTISDDGQGFDWKETFGSHNASGLKNILKRAEMADLDCQVHTSLGKGCTYKLLQMA